MVLHYDFLPASNGRHFQNFRLVNKCELHFSEQKVRLDFWISKIPHVQMMFIQNVSNK